MIYAPVVLTLLLAGAPPPGRTYSVDPARSVVRFHVVHKLHAVHGQSATIEGKGVIQDDGKLLAMVRVPMSSFDSGEGNRDANMREAVDVLRFPFVVFKGIARLGGDVVPVTRTTTVESRMDGEVELHGVKKPVSVPLTIDFSPDGVARARGSFEVSLEAFGIERPSLLFVKINDACKIDVDLSLREERP